MAQMNLALATLPTAGAGPQTMTSLEIAELTGKRHEHVVRDIRRMVEDLGEAFPHLWGKVATGGRPMEVAYLTKRESLILVSGYSVKLRAAIIDRWAELEAHGPAPRLLQPGRRRARLGFGMGGPSARGG